MDIRIPFRGDPRIAVLIPCYNEAQSVGGVVRDFRRALPTSQIYVYDNNSSDDTVDAARAAGAIVRSESYQGKGNVVRRMFADIAADIYVMVDGDGTYDADAAPKLVQVLIDNNLDLVCGARRPTEVEAFRLGHKFGNHLLTGLVRLIFGHGFRDMLTGYRVFSHRFVKSFPGQSRGFEIETELTVHALQMRLPIAEVETDYGTRPEGSKSKLRTIRDGIIIFQMIGLLVKEEKPFAFFGTLACLVAFTGMVFFAPVFFEYLRTGLVPRFPTLVVAVGAEVLAALLFACGLVLDTVVRARMETRRLSYLNASMIASPAWFTDVRDGEGYFSKGTSRLPETSRDSG
jgi:glycosyltransferase involved in cell wall biosynthesis